MKCFRVEPLFLFAVFLSSSLFVFLCGILLSSACLEFTLTSTAYAAGTAPGKNRSLVNLSGPEDCCHPEIVEVLNARRRELDKKAEELDRRQRELDLVLEDIESKIAELKELQKKLEEPVNSAVEEKQKNFKHLVGVYSKMDPANAAALLDRMDEDEVAAILAAMKSKNVAAIFANMSPEKAARISAMIAK